MANLPANHPLRVELNDEAHARPPEALIPPLRISYLVLLSDASMRDPQQQHVAALAQHYGVAPPPVGAIHYSIDMGPFRLKWERHSEFSRYTFVVPGAITDSFADAAIDAVPADWVAALSGQTIVATHALVLPLRDGPLDYDALSERLFAGNPLVGAGVAGGTAIALTDFRIHADGFGRLLVLDNGLRPRQAGRAVQRLLEIDTYRLMAQLALPVARQMLPFIVSSERELAQITALLTGANESNEPELLDRLTKLAAQIENQESQHHYRFSASRAYYQLVQQRISELREERLTGLQPFREFTELRLAPAMNTCSATAARQESLSLRIARATQLLSTRVSLTREHQEMAVLESMNRRADLQLRLQQTVEGLSVAAITYYIIGLIGYAAKGLAALRLPVNPEMAEGLSIPLVVLFVTLSIRRIHRMVHRANATDAHT